MPLVETETLKLNLGCGNSPIKGYLGVDKVQTSATDLVFDLEKSPWPFEPDSVDSVVMIHFVEHLKDFIGFFNELYVVMRPEGKVYIVGPYYQSSGCWQDPTHTRALNEKLFLYLSRKCREGESMNMAHYPLRCDFEICEPILYELEEEWKNKSDRRKAFAIKHFNNVVAQFRVVLKAVK